MIELMKLPYARDALEPAISKEIVDYHYGKHHKGYVDNLNALIKDTVYTDTTVEDIIQTMYGATMRFGEPVTSATQHPIFQNAAQVYNHNLYWNSLRPEEPIGASMSSVAKNRIEKYYGSLENLQKTIKQAGTKHFGSGWVWVCERKDKSLFVQTSHDADTPIVDLLITPLLVIDVWEHAYYLEYKNDRGAYFDAIWSIVNWDKIA